MSNIVVFPGRTDASRARVATMAAEAVAHLLSVTERQDREAEERLTLQRTADAARRAIRALHHAAAKAGERPWAARVVDTELQAIREHIEPAIG